MRRAFVALLSAPTLTAAAFACGESLSINDSPSSADGSSPSDGGPSDEATSSSSSGSPSDGGDAQTPFCDQFTDDLFCADFGLPPPERDWNRAYLANDASISIDTTASQSPPSSFSSVAREDDAVATLIYQLPDTHPAFSLDFDFQAGPAVMGQGATARLLTLNIRDVPNRAVRLNAVVQNQSFSLSVVNVVLTELEALPTTPLADWSHLHIEAKRDDSIDAGPLEKVWRFTVKLNDKSPVTVLQATKAESRNEPFFVELGVDKGTIGGGDNSLVNVRFDNVRIRKLE